MYNKTVIEFGFSVMVISLSYLDLDNSVYHENLIQ
jgi:hypothetical protein